MSSITLKRKFTAYYTGCMAAFSIFLLLLPSCRDSESDNSVPDSGMNDADVDTGTEKDAGDKEDAADSDAGMGLCYSNGWCWMNPLPQGNTLNGVLAFSGDDVYAAGDFGTIMHFDGSRWALMKSPTDIDLNDLWGTGENEIFAVGGDSSSDSNGVVLHYNGGEWSVMAGDIPCSLKAVWGSSPTSVFSVCKGGDIYFYDGSSWELMEETTAYDLQDIWGTSRDNVYAVGWENTILRYDGSSWTQIQGLEQNYINLTGVWGSSASDIYVVGEQGWVLHYDGDSWSRLEDAPECQFTGVWGNGADDVHMIGAMGYHVHYDGNSWNLEKQELTCSHLHIHGTSFDNVFAVGEHGLISRYDGQKWSLLSRGYTRSDLSGIHGSPESGLFSVGSWGTVLHYNGESWTKMESFTYSHIAKVWVSAQGDAYCTVNNGELWRWNGEIWKQFYTSNAWQFTSLFGFSDTDIYIAGGALKDSLGGIFHYDGNTVSMMEIPATGAITDLWGLSRDDLYATGENADLLHYDGVSWSRLAHMDQGCLGIWASSQDDIFMVGYDGYIRHYDGSMWSEMESHTEANLRRLTGTGPDCVFAIGNETGMKDNGVVLFYNGNKWSDSIIASHNDLNDITIYKNMVFISGDNGMIMAHPLP